MIKRESNSFRVLCDNGSIFIFGPRGTGKSALVKTWLPRLRNHLVIDLLKEREYLSYLQNHSRLSEEVAAAFLGSRTKLTVIIDEVQRIPSLLNEVHSLIEDYGNRIRFVLTGSSARKLKRDGANLLAGRAIVEHLYPFTNREMNISLKQALSLGTLPKAATSPKTAPKFLRTYVETYLKEEIKQEALVRRLDIFVRFLELAAQLNAEPINYSKIAKGIGSTHVSVENYFSILEDTMIVSRINGWAHSVKKQLLQAPRYYFFDCGILNALRGELRSELRDSSFRYGKLFETWVVNEVIRIIQYRDLDLKLNYWRTDTGVEVDLVISRGYGRALAAIEIKSTQTPSRDDFAGLLSFADDYPEVPLYCFCDVKRALKIERVLCVPWKAGINEIISKIALG
jgi:predicted AAA+ superfamily ATPase